MLNRIRQALKQQEGFTLVELMIVVVIIGIISGIAIQQYGKVQEKARKTAHNANVRIIEGAAQMYIASGGKALGADETIDDVLVPNYLKEIPINPLTNERDYKLSIKGNFEEGFSIEVTPKAVEL
mgnify:CR=1 FL=1